MNETDPNGIPAHAPGAKLDEGKPRIGLLFSGFPQALRTICLGLSDLPVEIRFDPLLGQSALALHAETTQLVHDTHVPPMTEEEIPFE